MNDGGKMRAFLAIEPPSDVLEKICAVQNHLKKTVKGAISWVRPGGVHLTLKFFGDISEKDVVDISKVTGSIAARFQPLDLNVKTTGIFPDMRRPRVIWIGVAGDTAPLKAMQSEIDCALLPLGIPREDRGFHPHLTLARVKAPKGLVGLSEIMDKKGDYEAGSFLATKLLLFKSDLTPKGAIYTRLGTFPLQNES